VATTGDDANPGTAARPFRTIQKAADVAQTGQTVVVRPGRYAGFSTRRSGTAAAPIVFRAEFPAVTAASSQRTVLAGGGAGTGIAITGHSHLTVDGFEVTNFAGGIRVSSNGQFLTIRRNVLRSNTGQGVQCASCSNSRFEANHFLDPGPPYPDLANATQDYGLNFYGGSGNAVVGNYFFGKHNQALSLKHSVGNTYVGGNTFEGCMYTCLYLGQNDDDYGGSGDLTSWDVVVEGNTFRDITSGSYYRVSNAVTIRNVQNATVRNNVFTRTYGAAIVVHKCQESCTQHGRAPVGALIAGNTIGNCLLNDPYTGAGGTRVLVDIQNRGVAGDMVEATGNQLASCPVGFRVASGAPVSIHGNTFNGVGTIGPSGVS
jgi:hypothetical protein